MLLDGGCVLDGAGGHAGPAGDVVAGLASWWQNLPLGFPVQVLQLTVARAFFQFAVAVEFEGERRPLRGGQVSTLQRSEDDVLNLVRWLHNPDGEFCQLQCAGGGEAFAPVQHDSSGGDFERLDDAASPDVVDQGGLAVNVEGR